MGNFGGWKSENFPGKSKILKNFQVRNFFSEIGVKSETGGNASLPQGDGRLCVYPHYIYVIRSCKIL